ncbi:E3 ubiquitin-protein ligase TRIM39-like isoform X2 [Oncorhynchus tshawytscha]|uniref:E3 ubiquitin-protein ligase TRIM39-like isoform X2 n=1 Tax=Oncorhynchus tshawytscha TaxID=74940 RepID=UPI000D0A450C|nr:E3 ubiquitin-protein ligase TRIM39-like isoform X2 [Oncorhynchus tshawytscha]
MPLGSEKMASQASVPEKDLPCPVCSEILKEPVLLSCGHSCCIACLESYWKWMESWECPVCSIKCYKDSMALKNLCMLSENVSAKHVCSLHSKQLTLFCLEHEEPVCSVCEGSSKHNTHECIPVDEAALDRKSQAQKTENQIQEDFEKLHQFLRYEEAARMAVLREEEEEKSRRMKKMIDDMNREIAAILDTTRAIKKDLVSDDISFLQNYKDTLKRAQCTSPDPELVSGALINVAKHLGNLQVRVLEKMLKSVQYTPVILDPNTAHPCLILSDDLTSMRFSDEIQLLPDNPERFDNYRMVLGSEGFDSGTHSWDTDVRDNTIWFVGVVYKSVQRKGVVQTGLWRVGYFNDKYWARCPKGPQTVLTLENKPHRIRVQLDWNRDTLSFYDLDNNTHIHTFTQTFTERLFPYINIGSNLYAARILPGKVSVTVEQHMIPPHASPSSF